jgi:hypothetical protein
LGKHNGRPRKKRNEEEEEEEEEGWAAVSESDCKANVLSVPLLCLHQSVTTSVLALEGHYGFDRSLEKRRCRRHGKHDGSGVEKALQTQFGYTSIINKRSEV